VQRPFDVRDAVEADVDAILEIYNEVIANSTAVYATEPVPLSERLSWFKERRARGYPVLVATKGSVVVGFASFGEWRGAWHGFRYTVEHSVHVRADERGRGVGFDLVEALFPYARARNVHVMVGGIDAANLDSIRFHERLGFRRVAHFHEVGRKFGRWLDLVFMQRMVDGAGERRND